MQQLNIKWLNLSYYLHNTLFPAVQLFDIISIIDDDDDDDRLTAFDPGQPG